MMREYDHGDVVLKEDNGIYEKGDTLKSFHHQAHQPISRKAFFGRLSVSVAEEVCSAISFQRCHFPDGTAFDRLLGARSLSGLLLAMVCSIK